MLRQRNSQGEEELSADRIAEYVRKMKKDLTFLQSYGTIQEEQMFDTTKETF